METKIQKLIDNPNLRSQTYKILKNMIITREILPGKKISEETLAQRIDTEQVVVLVDKIIDYYRANAKPKERMGKMIERLGLAHMEEALGLGNES